MATIAESWRQGRTERAARPARTRAAVLPAIVKAIATRAPSWKRSRSALLQVAGFGFLDYAVYGWNHLAGFAAIGVSLFVLEALSGDGRNR